MPAHRKQTIEAHVAELPARAAAAGMRYLGLAANHPTLRDTPNASVRYVFACQGCGDLSTRVRYGIEDVDLRCEACQSHQQAAEWLADLASVGLRVAEPLPVGQRLRTTSRIPLVCVKGHVNSTDDIGRAHRRAKRKSRLCSGCTRERRLAATRAQLDRILAAGYTLTSPLPQRLTARMDLDLLCPKKHPVHKSINALAHRGSTTGCGTCAVEANRISLDALRERWRDVHCCTILTTHREIGQEFIQIFCHATQRPFRWRAHRAHRRPRCKWCDCQRERWTRKQVAAEASKRGFTLVSERYYDANTLMLFRCLARGHEFESRVSYLFASDTTRCPKCHLEDVSWSREEIEERVTARGGFVIEWPSILTLDQHVQTRCGRGHPPWSPTIGQLMADQWCPACPGPRIAELLVADVLIHCGIKFLRNTRPEFLRFGRGRLQLDFYLPDYGVAIEVHGRQHYVWVPHFHPAEALFAKQQKYDRIKAERCLKEGISLLVVEELGGRTPRKDIAIILADMLRQKGVHVFAKTPESWILAEAMRRLFPVDTDQSSTASPDIAGRRRRRSGDGAPRSRRVLERSVVNQAEARTTAGHADQLRREA